MSEEFKKVVDEEIRNNAKTEEEIRKEINNMTDEELLSDDIDVMDMFRGCKIT